MIKVSEYYNSTDILVRDLERYKGNNDQFNAVVFMTGWFQSEKDSDPQLYTSDDIHRIFENLYQIGQKIPPQPTKAMQGNNK